MENTKRIEIISTIDALNQYLLGHVTKDGIVETLHHLIREIKYS